MILEIEMLILSTNLYTQNEVALASQQNIKLAR